jgi:hypothetical protein
MLVGEFQIYVGMGKQKYYTNNKNGKIRSHVDYISESVGQPKDNSCIWELEVKAKDKAILQLMKG